MISDKLDELENLQKKQKEDIEQRMASMETKLIDLDSLTQDMEAILCYFMGSFTEEKSKISIKGIASCKAEIESMKQELFMKEQEAVELKRILELDNTEKKNLLEELIKQQTTADHLRKALEEKQEETEKRNYEIAEEKTKAKVLNEELKAEKTKLQQVKAIINKYQSKVQDLNEDLTQKTIEAQNLSEQLNSKQEEADYLNAENKELKQSIEKGTELFGKKTRELEELKAREEELNQLLIQEKKKVTMLENKFGCWKEEIKDYQELLGLVFECESLVPLMEDYKLIKINGSEDVANLIHFVNLLGDRASFLPIMYDYLEDYKEEKREAVNQAEKKLFACLNSYYKKNYEISSDLIRYPQEGAKFEPESMKDFDSRRKMFRSIECVYVPAVMRDEKNYLKLALVKGIL